MDARRPESEMNVCSRSYSSLRFSRLISGGLQLVTSRLLVQLVKTYRCVFSLAFFLVDMATEWSA